MGGNTVATEVFRLCGHLGNSKQNTTTSLLQLELNDCFLRRFINTSEAVALLLSPNGQRNLTHPQALMLKSFSHQPGGCRAYKAEGKSKTGEGGSTTLLQLPKGQKRFKGRQINDSQLTLHPSSHSGHCASDHQLQSTDTNTATEVLKEIKSVR